jgi:hypothetical protein
LLPKHAVVDGFNPYEVWRANEEVRRAPEQDRRIGARAHELNYGRGDVMLASVIHSEEIHDCVECDTCAIGKQLRPDRHLWRRLGYGATVNGQDGRQATFPVFNLTALVTTSCESFGSHPLAQRPRLGGQKQQRTDRAH